MVWSLIYAGIYTCENSKNYNLDYRHGIHTENNTDIVKWHDVNTKTMPVRKIGIVSMINTMSALTVTENFRLQFWILNLNEFF